MRREISITNAEPVRHSVFAYLFETTECLVAKSPSAFGIELAGQTVHDRINIRADVQTPNVGVVTNINYHVNVFFRNDANQTPQEFRGAGSTGENSIVRGSHANILCGA